MVQSLRRPVAVTDTPPSAVQPTQWLSVVAAPAVVGLLAALARAAWRRAPLRTARTPRQTELTPAVFQVAEKARAHSDYFSEQVQKAC